MVKEIKIKEMKNKIEDFCSCIDGECDTSCSKCLSNFLVNAGYGNVKQAIKEFAEKLKELLYADPNYEMNIGQHIDNLITELYGADE